MAADASTLAAYRVCLADEDDFDGWRHAARGLAAAEVPSSAISWHVAGKEADLFAGPETQAPPPGPSFAMPRKFVELAGAVICHRDPERFALLYQLMTVVRRNRHAIDDHADPLLARIERMAKEVRRDAHKMHAFVRFREVTDDDGPRFVAWFEPDNHIVRREAGFFVRRFANMRWSILTPELSINWDGEALTEGPGTVRSAAPDGDPVEKTWKTYYANIFNPARVKVKAMTKEMPKKYWKNMPETALIGGLLAVAQNRESEMIAISQSQAPPPPSNIAAAWQALRSEAAACTRCDLYRCATQTVFGEGPLDASILFVGEQPGDQEDLAGRPFVGPAGELFDAALAEAGIDRATAYVTNAVKHFKFVQRGKRRIHDRPNAGEIEACRWWQEQERGLVKPAVTVALGATAIRSLTGRTIPVTKAREAPIMLADGSECWVTVHPSYLLRLPDEAARHEERSRFVEDLRRIADRAAELRR